MRLQIGTASMKNSMGVPQKLENRNTIWLRNSTPKYLPEEKVNTNLKRAIMHSYVHYNIVYNKQDMEAT